MMREKLRNRILIWAVCFAGSAIAVLCGGRAVYAAPNDFAIEAECTASDKETKTLQVTVSNQGEDWEGTVRVRRKTDYYYEGNVAYDTKISLPQGSVKQFTVKIPVQQYDDSDGTVRVTLYDKKKREVTYREYKQILAGEGDFLNMGVLSDGYNELMYLDMGGGVVTYRSLPYPVRLSQVDADVLKSSLDALQVLVIDRYNTSLLSDEQKQEIYDWVYAGGVLILGTGEYADDTLNGMMSDLEMSCKGVCDPFSGEQSQEEDGETQTGQNEPLSDGRVAVEKLHFALLDDVFGTYTVDYRTFGCVKSSGDGAVLVLPYSLTELGKMGEDFYNGDYYATDQETYVRTIIETVAGYATIPYTSQNASYYDSSIRDVSRIMNFWGGRGSRLNFGLLKVIVVLYVIFVGPILYLILMAVKRRELYWIAAPVTAFCGIILIFLAGRGFEVVDTTVFSVTAKNLSDRGKETSYLYCYDAGHKEWSLKLKPGYDYVGAIAGDSYHGGDDEDAYYYHVCREGDRMSFGIKPGKGFEDTYFYAGKGADPDCDEQIDISALQFSYVGAGAYGEIANRTDKDFDYFAVIADQKIYVYDGLKAGETFDLSSKMPVFDSSQSYGKISSEYMYDYLADESLYRKRSNNENGMLSALGIGICVACDTGDPDAIAVVGVTDDWDDVVDDRCKEASYGCLYVIQ